MQRPYMYSPNMDKMNTTGQTFDKSERLCSRKIMDELFDSGNIFYNPLFKIVWNDCTGLIPGPAQTAFSVSKKGFRLAVTRNLIKRRMREAFRKNKMPLYEHLLSKNIQISFIVILRGKAVPDYLTIERTMKDAIKKLIIITGRKPEDADPNC